MKTSAETERSIVRDHILIPAFERRKDLTSEASMSHTGQTRGQVTYVKTFNQLGQYTIGHW